MITCFVRLVLVVLIVSIVAFVTVHGPQMTPKAKFMYGLGAGILFYLLTDSLSWKTKFMIYGAVGAWIVFVFASGLAKW